MPPPLWKPVERLRRIWSPDREIYELADSLEPSTQLDSQIRELFSRVMKGLGQVELDVTEPVDGFIRWEEVRFGQRRIVSVWWLPTPDERTE